MTLLDLMEAKAVGHASAEASAGRADRVSEGWTATATKLFILYAYDIAQGRPFLTEQARAWAEKHGLTTPPDGRAWGHIASSLRRSGRVICVGYAPAKTSNGSQKCLWKHP